MMVILCEFIGCARTLTDARRFCLVLCSTPVAVNRNFLHPNLSAFVFNVNLSVLMDNDLHNLDQNHDVWKAYPESPFAASLMRLVLHCTRLKCVMVRAERVLVRYPGLDIPSDYLCIPGVPLCPLEAESDQHVLGLGSSRHPIL